MDPFAKKDPDSFSLDGDNIDQEISPKSFGCASNQPLSPQNLTPRTKSPRLQQLDSFSKEYPPPANQEGKLNALPFNAKMTLRICQAMNKEGKAIKKFQDLLKEIDENLKNVDQMVRRQEKHVDEFYQEIYDVFVQNFFNMVESYRKNFKSQIQKQYSDYQNTHQIVRQAIDHILANDNFARVLEQEILEMSTYSPRPNTPKAKSSNILNDLDKEEFTANQSSNKSLEQYFAESLDIKLGLTPLVKKSQVSHYFVKHRAEDVNLSQSDVRKGPFNEFIHIQQELETLISNLTNDLGHDIVPIQHPYSAFATQIDKMAKTPVKIITLNNDASLEEEAGSHALRKRLSQIDLTQLDNSRSMNSLERETNEKIVSKSPTLTSTSPKIFDVQRQRSTSLTPVKSVTYKVPSKENKFTGNAGWFNEDQKEIKFDTQLVSVHNNLVVGDLVSINDSPYRIIHKEWNFPNDTVQMVNIFTGERIEEVYHSRHHNLVEQIKTKKSQLVKVSHKRNYFLVVDMTWDKSEQFKKQPRTIETRSIMDKKLEDDIRDAFESRDKKVVVIHTLKIKNEDVIVSYRKEWF